MENVGSKGQRKESCGGLDCGVRRGWVQGFSESLEKGILKRIEKRFWKFKKIFEFKIKIEFNELLIVQKIAELRAVQFHFENFPFLHAPLRVYVHQDSKYTSQTKLDFSPF